MSVTDLNGDVWLRLKVIDGTKPVSATVHTETPTRGLTLQPVDPREQTMLVNGQARNVTSTWAAPAPAGTVKIGKLDGVSGKPVAGAKLRLTGPNGYSKDFTSTATLITVPDVVGGSYTLTETAPPPGYIAQTPAPSATGTLTPGGELTLRVDNYRTIGGATTASETVVTSDGDTQVFDEITVTGVDADQEVKVEAVFFANENLVTSPLPVTLAAGICKPENEVGRQTVTVKGPGPHKVGPFTIPSGFRGVTTFQDRVVGAGPQMWLDACGQPKETTVVYPPIKGSTQALDTDPAGDEEPGSEIVSEDGAQVWDRVDVIGLAEGETAEVTAQLFKDPAQEFPFEEGFSAEACDPKNLIGEPITVTVTGKGSSTETDTVTVGPFAIPAGSEGKVSFLDKVTSITGDGDRENTRTWEDTCGNPTETLIVRKPIEAKTKVSETFIVSDDQVKVYDVVETNLNEDETATLVAEVHGVYPVDHVFAEDNDDCSADSLLSTFTIDVKGPGPHKVGPYRTDANAEGLITWQDGLKATVGEDQREWLDGCGTPEETTKVRRPLKGSTQASHREVTNTGDVELFDEVVIEGIRDNETATVTANIYGPYDKMPNPDQCGEGELLESFEVEVTGPGPHRVGPYKVPADMVGFVTWQDGVEHEDGRVWLDGCGRVTETTEIKAPQEPETPPTTVPETPPTTVPETPPTTVPETTPGKTTQTTVKPVAPSNPDQPSTPSKPAPPTTNLAYTGGSIVLALVAGGLLLSGFVLVRRRKGVSAD